MKKIILLIVIFAALTAILPAQTNSEDLAVLNRMMRLKMDGLIPLRFSNALDAKPIEGATVTVNGIGTFLTNSEGIISFPEQEDGFYTLEFSKQGYISSRIEFEVKLNNVFNGRFSISPEMRGDYLRIVLDWGQQPADLDLHLVKEGGYHVSYWDMHNAADGSVTLDRDACNGFGPETITIAVGFGKQNTQIIVDRLRQLGESNRASQICAGLDINGYKDWFLPSKDELNLMYTNLKAKGLGGFSNSWYWSSSQGSNNFGAWGQRFSDGYQGNYGYDKNGTNSVRAVRAF